MHLKWETNQMNFKCISREKEKRKKSYENITTLPSHGFIIYKIK